MKPVVVTSLLLMLALFSPRLRAEDVPLETCDGLPVVKVSVLETNFLFLVDTAATSMLNLKSFTHGDAKKIAVTSWSGTVETKAQEIKLQELVIGAHHLNGLNLPAVDLSAIGHACGRQIDGILGVDLLSRLGATIDLSRKTAHLASDSEAMETRVAELHQQLVGCERAFNRTDEAAFADCLDPQVVIFTAGGDYYGRDASMEYYRRRYFRHEPRPELQITPRGHHAIGDAIWVEYDLKISMGQETILARGTALCEKQRDKWRIVHMNHSAPPVDGLHASNPQ